MVRSRVVAPRRPKPAGRFDDVAIAEMIDHVTQAKRMADALEQRFLSYLLAMVMQEANLIEARRANAAGANRTRKRDKAPSARTD